MQGDVILKNNVDVEKFIKGIFDEHYERLVNILCFKYKCSWEDAVDACQDAFIKLFKEAHKQYTQPKRKKCIFEEKQAMAFLYVTSQNKLIDIFRKTGKRSSLPTNFDLGEKTMCKSENDYNVVRAKICAMRLEEKSQQIIKIKFWEEKTFEEIAETLEMKLSTVKTKYYRALENLKTCMKVEINE